MNITHDVVAERPSPQRHSALVWALADAFVIAKRQIRQIPRIPDERITATLQPAIVVLLFRYIIGGAIAVPGTSYVNYLMAGVFVQSVVFGAANTGVGVANDLQRGLTDHFRSLPMAPSAVLTGRVLADLICGTFIMLVTWGIGLLVGFRLRVRHGNGSRHRRSYCSPALSSRGSRR